MTDNKPMTATATTAVPTRAIVTLSIIQAINNSAKVWIAQMSNMRITGLLKNGVFIAPSQYETVFLSESHTDVDITKALGAYGLSLKAMKN